MNTVSKKRKTLKLRKIVRCEHLFGGNTVQCCEMYNCCNCGDSECGCHYCFSCNACETCKGEEWILTKAGNLLETMPEGWKLDKTAGSPLFGYSFVTNGKSVLNGQLRALLRVVQPQMQICYEEQSKPIPPQGINKKKSLRKLLMMLNIRVQ